MWLVAILITAQILVGCAAVKSIGRVIGREDGLISTLIHDAAIAAGHSEEAIKSAAQKAGSAIDSAVTPMLKSESQEAQAARSVFTSVVCDTIATRVQTGNWPSDTAVKTSAFTSVIGEFSPRYSLQQLGNSALSVAKSVWNGTATDQEAVRNVVCAAVGVKT